MCVFFRDNKLSQNLSSLQWYKSERSSWSLHLRTFCILEKKRLFHSHISVFSVAVLPHELISQLMWPHCHWARFSSLLWDETLSNVFLTGCSSSVRVSSTHSASSCRCVTSWRPNTTWWSLWVPFTLSNNLIPFRKQPMLTVIIILSAAVRGRRQEVLHHGRRSDSLHRSPAAGGVPPDQQGNPARLPQTPLRLCGTINPCFLYTSAAQCDLSSWPRISHQDLYTDIY